MGLFGNTDASEVPDNPFYVAPDTYSCVLTEVNRVQTKDGSKEGLAFKWVIEDEDSEYHGSQIQDWKNIWPDAEEITPNIKKDNARLKQRLLELGLTEDQMNDLLDNLDDLVGIVAYVTVTESHDKNDPSKVYTNVKSIRIDE